MKLFECYTGSKLFCNNCKDTDLLIIYDEEVDENYERVEQTCHFKYSLKQLKEHLKETKHLAWFALTLELAKQYKYVLYGKHPLPEYSIFDHKLELLRQVLKDGETSYFCPLIRHRNGGCSKRMVWALATYYAIINNSIIFTTEQKQIMQQCHDGYLPKEYAYELKEKIENLILEL